MAKDFAVWDKLLEILTYASDSDIQYIIDYLKRKLAERKRKRKANKKGLV